MQWRDLPYPQPELNEDVDTVNRQSIIGQLQLCGYREKLKTHKGFLEPVNEKMCFGTLEHYLISQDILTGEPRLDLLVNMNEWVEEILVNEYNWTLSKVPNVRDFFSELASAYRQWRSDVQPTLGTPIAIEKEMYVFLAQGAKGNLWLKGTPDVVYPNVLVDWKTTGKAWSASKAHLSIQASLYMALVKQNLDVAIRKFDFWIYDRSKKVWTRIRTERTVKAINAALISAEDYARVIESGLYMATPVPEAQFPKKRGWYCKPTMCGSWNICPAKYLGDDVDEREIGERTW